jgi:hypothetical protein
MRVARAGIQVPTVEVRFEDISVDTSVYVGSRALPSVINSYRNIVEARDSSPASVLCAASAQSPKSCWAACYVPRLVKHACMRVGQGEICQIYVKE